MLFRIPEFVAINNVKVAVVAAAAAPEYKLRRYSLATELHVTVILNLHAHCTHT